MFFNFHYGEKDMNICKPQIYYHGSGVVVESPNLLKSREDIDFGVGFYLTTDKMMAKKWASSRANAIVNEYSVNIMNLNSYIFSLDKEWLEFVRANRGYGPNQKEIIKQYKSYDVLIGPTADDKLFDTIQQYLDGYLSPFRTLKYLNIAGYSNQIVLKTAKSIENCTFLRAKELVGAEKQDAKLKAMQDRINANKRLDELKKADARMDELYEERER